MAKGRVRPALQVFLVLAVGVSGCKEPKRAGGDSAPSASAAAPAGNAVQREMRLLTEALRESVTDIGYGKLAAIPPALHRVDVAKEETEHALESGEYKLRKNSGDLKGFEELDEAFHAELEKLAEKAASNNPVATSTELGVVLSKCDGCHSRFRP